MCLGAALAGNDDGATVSRPKNPGGPIKTQASAHFGNRICSCTEVVKSSTPGERVLQHASARIGPAGRGPVIVMQGRGTLQGKREPGGRRRTFRQDALRQPLGRGAPAQRSSRWGNCSRNLPHAEKHARPGGLYVGRWPRSLHYTLPPCALGHKNGPCERRSKSLKARSEFLWLIRTSVCTST